ncbi:putative thioredoxin [Trichinella nativa]|uniref:Putative thioredoxin n=1 Tax=Trichinella nativa TaxID=6335 RepID=A0A1Y3ESB3_9BILA|nr:putative thioredoxin [Trichinella nativa]
MAISWKSTFNEYDCLFTPYHFLNVLLCICFYVTKTVEPLCHFLYGSDTKCFINEREYQIMLLMGIMIFVKNKRATAAITVSVFFPQPAYTGLESVIYFRGNSPLDEIAKNKDVVWLIEFYANWSAPCHYLAPVFAKISVKYSLPNFKFGKIDVGRYSDEANKLNISTKVTSSALPTLILFRDGKEVKRIPKVTSNGRTTRYHFTEENIIRDFDLNNILLDCKRQSKTSSGHIKSD